MTSTNDGKDVKSNQTSGQKGKKYYIELYNSLDARLNSDCALRTRTAHLCSAWACIHSICRHALPASHPLLLAWLERHTARIVLQTEWQSPSSKDEHEAVTQALDGVIQEIAGAASQRNDIKLPWENVLEARANWFKGMLSNPWDHPVLRILLDPGRETSPIDDDVIEWLKGERDIVFVTRLRQLVASKCDDLATSLATFIMDRVRAGRVIVPDAEQAEEQKDKAPSPENKSPTFEDRLRSEAGFTEDIWALLTDMELVLLLKVDRRSRCIELAKQLPLRSGYELIQRLQKRLEGAKTSRDKRLWKNATEVATLIAQVVIARCMVIPVCSGVSRGALYWSARALASLLEAPQLRRSAVALAAPATTSHHLYWMAKAVHMQKNMDEMKPFVCELYVRAITFGMNELEKLKLDPQKEPQARLAEQTLASWFLELGGLFASERFKCECTLTAFSVHPSPDMYKRIKEAPHLPKIAVDPQEPKDEVKSEFGSWATDSRSQTNFVKTSEHLNMKQTQQQANVLSTAILTEGEALGLEVELCQDISVLLSGPRVKTLSWDMDRSLLLENCRQYMERTGGGTRALTTELKYLNINPDDFQHLPEEDEDENDLYYGIEKGYEHLVEFQEPEPETIWNNIWESETAFSSGSETDSTTVSRRKKKTVKMQSSDSEDCDPLSLVAAECKKKKERPHSKERSKDKRKQRKENTNDAKKEKKEKKERKKKEKTSSKLIHTPSSLSNLVGIKVSRVDDKNLIAVTGSDLDSQGKCSFSSDNDPNVIVDGQFSMDELKSPESRSSGESMKPSLSSLNGAKVLKAETSTKPKSNANAKKPTFYGPNEDVKRRISKLLQFRRKKMTTSSTVPQVKPTQDTVKTELSSLVGSKIIQPPECSVSEVSKYTMTKKQTEELSALSKEVSNMLTSNKIPTGIKIANPIKSYDLPKGNNACSRTLPISAEHAIRKPVPNLNMCQNVSLTQPLNLTKNNNAEQQNVQQIIQSPQNLQIQPNIQNKLNEQILSIEQNKIVNTLDSNKPGKPYSAFDAQQKNFQQFLKELQGSINPGKDNKPKDNKVHSRKMTPVIVNNPEYLASSSSAKAVVQPKKGDTAPNTFSRLSYMHKKQGENKSKQTHNEVNKMSLQSSISAELDQRVADFHKLKYLQNKGITISQAKPQETPRVEVQNIEQTHDLSRVHPLLTNMLNSSLSSVNKPKNETPANSLQIKSTASENKSTLSDKDQQDLLSLLRQKANLNETITQKKLQKFMKQDTLRVPQETSKSNDTFYSPNSSPSSQSSPSIMSAPQNKVAVISTADAIRTANMIQQNKPNIECKPKQNIKKDSQRSLHEILPKTVNVKKFTKKQNSSKDDWTKVLDAIRAQKTPSRGPNALDMVMKKDMYEKYVQDTSPSKNVHDNVKKDMYEKYVQDTSPSKNVHDNELTDFVQTQAAGINKHLQASNSVDSEERIKISGKVPNIVTNTVTSKKINNELHSTNRSIASFDRHETKPQGISRTPYISNSVNIPIDNSQSKKPAAKKTVSSAKSKINMQAPIVVTRKPNENTKSYPSDIFKRNDEQNKKFLCDMPKEDDPFISGLQNSDYDLLEELMDDELRKEIGELSDEERLDSIRHAITDEPKTSLNLKQFDLKESLQNAISKDKPKIIVDIRGILNKENAVQVTPTVVEQPVKTNKIQVVETKVIKPADQKTVNWKPEPISQKQQPPKAKKFHKPKESPSLPNSAFVSPKDIIVPSINDEKQKYRTNQTNIHPNAHLQTQTVQPNVTNTVLLTTVSQPLIQNVVVVHNNPYSPYMAPQTAPSSQMPTNIYIPVDVTPKLQFQNAVPTPTCVVVENTPLTVPTPPVLFSGLQQLAEAANYVTSLNNNTTNVICKEEPKLLKEQPNLEIPQNTRNQKIESKIATVEKKPTNIDKSERTKDLSNKEPKLPRKQLISDTTQSINKQNIECKKDTIETNLIDINKSELTSNVKTKEVSKFSTKHLNVDTTQDIRKQNMESNNISVNKKPIHIDIKPTDLNIAERKVLSEVQEKLEMIPEKAVLKQLRSSRSSCEQHITQERIKNKRLAIINREISQRCFYPPIPLMYASLKDASDHPIETDCKTVNSHDHNSVSNSKDSAHDIGKRNVKGKKSDGMDLLTNNNKKRVITEVKAIRTSNRIRSRKSNAKNPIQSTTIKNVNNITVATKAQQLITDDVTKIEKPTNSECDKNTKLVETNPPSIFNKSEPITKSNVKSKPVETIPETEKTTDSLDLDMICESEEPVRKTSTFEKIIVSRKPVTKDKIIKSTNSKAILEQTYKITENLPHLSTPDTKSALVNSSPLNVKSTSTTSGFADIRVTSCNSDINTTLQPVTVEIIKKLQSIDTIVKKGSVSGSTKDVKESTTACSSKGLTSLLKDQSVKKHHEKKTDTLDCSKNITTKGSIDLKKELLCNDVNQERVSGSKKGNKNSRTETLSTVTTSLLKDQPVKEQVTESTLNISKNITTNGPNDLIKNLQSIDTGVKQKHISDTKKDIKGCPTEILRKGKTSLLKDQSVKEYGAGSTQDISKNIINGGCSYQINEFKGNEVVRNSNTKEVVVIDSPVKTKAEKSDLIGINSAKALETLTKVTSDTEIKSSDYENDKITEDFKRNIKIEDIPRSEWTDPYKRMIRIRLPNGKSFKAKVFGSVPVSFETLFSDPIFRNLLTTGFRDTKRCTLSVQNYAMPNQIIVPTITEVKKPSTSSVLFGSVETVNLISDDEEEEPRFVFTTEYGKYFVKSIAKEIFEKHQIKLTQKCCVRIPKLRMKSQDKSRKIGCNTPTDFTKTSVIQNLVEAILKDVPLLQKETRLNSRDRTEVIEIDDSSNDSTVPDVSSTPKQITELTSLLLADLGVKDVTHKKKNTVKKLNSNTEDIPEKVEKIKDEPLNKAELNDETVGNPPKIEEISKDDVPRIENSPAKNDYSEILKCECFIKLVKCDHLLKTVEDSSDESVFGELLIPDSDNEDIIVNDYADSRSSRCDSVSLLQDHDDLLISCINTDSNGPTSPVMQAFETVAALCKIPSSSESGRTSPVMAIFDMIACLDKKATTSHTENNIAQNTEMQIKTDLSFFKSNWCKDTEVSSELTKKVLNAITRLEGIKEHHNFKKVNMEHSFRCDCSCIVTKSIIHQLSIPFNKTQSVLKEKKPSHTTEHEEVITIKTTKYPVTLSCQSDWLETKWRQQQHSVNEMKTFKHILHHKPNKDVNKIDQKCSVELSLSKIVLNHFQTTNIIDHFKPQQSNNHNYVMPLSQLKRKLPRSFHRRSFKINDSLADNNSKAPKKFKGSCIKSITVEEKKENVEENVLLHPLAVKEDKALACVDLDIRNFTLENTPQITQFSTDDDFAIEERLTGEKMKENVEQSIHIHQSAVKDDKELTSVGSKRLNNNIHPTDTVSVVCKDKKSLLVYEQSSSEVTEISCDEKPPNPIINKEYVNNFDISHEQCSRMKILEDNNTSETILFNAIALEKPYEHQGKKVENFDSDSSTIDLKSSSDSVATTIADLNECVKISDITRVDKELNKTESPKDIHNDFIESIQRFHDVLQEKITMVCEDSNSAQCVGNNTECTSLILENKPDRYLSDDPIETKNSEGSCEVNDNKTQCSEESNDKITSEHIKESAAKEFANNSLGKSKVSQEVTCKVQTDEDVALVVPATNYSENFKKDQQVDQLSEKLIPCQENKNSKKEDTIAPKDLLETEVIPEEETISDPVLDIKTKVFTDNLNNSTIKLHSMASGINDNTTKVTNVQDKCEISQEQNIDCLKNKSGEMINPSTEDLCEISKENSHDANISKIVDLKTVIGKNLTTETIDVHLYSQLPCKFYTEVIAEKLDSPASVQSVEPCDINQYKDIEKTIGRSDDLKSTPKYEVTLVPEVSLETEVISEEKTIDEPVFCSVTKIYAQNRNNSTINLTKLSEKHIDCLENKSGEKISSGQEDQCDITANISETKSVREQDLKTESCVQDVNGKNLTEETTDIDNPLFSELLYERHKRVVAESLDSPASVQSVELTDINQCDDIVKANARPDDLNLGDPNSSPENVTVIYKDDSGVVIKGVEYEVPEMGTLYVFPLVKSCDSSGNSDILNSSGEYQIEIDSQDDNRLPEDSLKLLEPKLTYSKQTRKRKARVINIEDFDVKRPRRSPRATVKYKFKKPKNIDYRKVTATTISQACYAAEYNRLLDYYSTIKFSYSFPFDKEYIDVLELVNNWPLLPPDTGNQLEENNFEGGLFVDYEEYNKSIFDPLSETLAEEITKTYCTEPSEDEAEESNFNMGFGEGSDRVKQNLVNFGTISEFSAATLSDVKHSQPFLLSEDSLTSDKMCLRDDQIEKMKRYMNNIRLKDKVRSFFKNNTLELNREYNKCIKKHEKNSFPFDLYITNNFHPSRVESIVQVVQVGQLPVSAAAQNPVSCDPRVTQVSNASPSHCNVEDGPQHESQSGIKTEYTELTTADLSGPMQNYAGNNLPMQSIKTQETANMSTENLPVNPDLIKSEVKIELIEDSEENQNEYARTQDSTPYNMEQQPITVNHVNNNEYSFNTNNTYHQSEPDSDTPLIFTSPVKEEPEVKDEPTFETDEPRNGVPEKNDQITYAMNAAGIETSVVTPPPRAHALVNIVSQKIRQNVATVPNSTNNFQKPVNTMSLQQALAQILPPSLNQASNVDTNNHHVQAQSMAPQVLHIVQGKNSSGNQITLLENSQHSVINTPNATPVLHIVQNKTAVSAATTNGGPNTQQTTFSGLSLVDTGLQQGGNQLLHIVNTGTQKNNTTGQLLKRVNLLTNIANVQGPNEQKMVQFVCKSADGKAIQLNAPAQRGMVLRLQPIETPNIQTVTPKPTENQEHNQTPTTGNSVPPKETQTHLSQQQEIKSRSVYEENYAKFIQNSTQKPQTEKSTSLPKFNQAFGKPVFQEESQKAEINSNSSHIPAGSNVEGSECPPVENPHINLEHLTQLSSPPLLIRKPTIQNTHSQQNLVQQIKQTIAPMNIQTMHGGVIYTRQIPVNIGGGQTINLITVPTTELIDDKQQNEGKFVNQGEIEPSIIKIVPQPAPPDVSNEGQNNTTTTNNENAQPQPVLTQMRIKLPMLSKAPQMVTGARVMRPSFFQIQRNVIGGTSQPVYQQLVLTTAPPLGQQTIRLPQAQTRPVKVPSESQSSTESMSSSTLEQLREFDMVLEQVKERSTVQPNSNTNFKVTSTDTTDSAISAPPTETTQQVLYSFGSNHSLNVAYVNRKATVATPLTSAFVRSPDSSGIADSPSSVTQMQVTQTVTKEPSSNDTPAAKPNKSKKSRSKSSSHVSNSLKLNTVPPKTTAQKPLEDEQTTQRILYILAEYKEQVENSPDKDKPAPRRRTNPPSSSGSSKRKKSSSSSRRTGRELSPSLGEDTSRTMGSEDSSCGTSQGDCAENCLEPSSPQDSPRKVVRKLTYEQEQAMNQSRPQQQRNVIVADGQTITVARGTAGKPATAVLMPANYLLPVSMVKGGQQIAIVTNRGPKLLTVGGGEGGTTNAVLLQRLIGPAGLKPVLARPGVRHVRLPTTALHNIQTFNIATTTTVQPPDSTASPAPVLTPPELVETRAENSPWPEESKPDRTSSPEGSEPWNIPTSADPQDYSYEETVRTDNLERTVLDPIPDRYSPDMEAQRIFDKMFDVDSKKSYIVDTHDDSPRCGYDIDASDEDKGYQVVHKKDGSHRQHRLAHVSAAALRHKYAILEHELRLQKSLSEECEDLGVDSPSAAELFPEAELLFASSPAQEHHHDHAHRPHTPQTLLPQSVIHPDIDDQIATDHLLPRNMADDRQDLDVNLGLEDVGIVTVSEDGMQATIALDQEEFARSHPNTTFHSEPTDDGEVQPFTIATGLKSRQISSTIFHSNRAPATVLMAAPQTSVISQATGDTSQNHVKYDLENMMHNMPSSHGNHVTLSSVLVNKDESLRYDNILSDNRELHFSNTASAIVHATGNAAQVIRRVCYDDDKRERERYLMDEPEGLIAGEDAKMIADDATLASMVDDVNSSPERNTELFWESNSASERSESRRPLDFSSDSDKCCKSPSYDETNSTDSSGVGTHMRLDSVIKDTRGIERSGSAGSSADDTHPPLRTYPPKRPYHAIEENMERSLSGKTRAGERSPDILEVRRRASGRGVVKRGCHCCNGSPAPPRPKKPRQRKPTTDFNAN